MTFAELKSIVRRVLWPDGEQENLVVPHDAFFVNALVDLQNSVDCLRFGNTDVYPSCATYFNCGMTVLPAPRGIVRRIYTIGKKSGVGQQVADKTIVCPLLAIDADTQALVSNPVSEDILEVASDGTYTVSVNQSFAAASLFPPNSPQYFRTEITYTDTNGTVQKIQPADLIHVNVGQVNGTSVIGVKAGTTISVTVTPFNAPQVDGDLSVEVIVTSGAQGVDDADWCSKVHYDQVEFCHIQGFANGINQCGCSFGSLEMVFGNIFGPWRSKSYIPTPDDKGLQGQPVLPAGFHYSQPSTDAGGRSRRGVFAIHRGQIYIAPWIETYEELVVEWDGVKPNWGDSDLVEDEPNFQKAVRASVGIQHFQQFEDNAARLQEFKKMYWGEPGVPGVLQELMFDCRERNRTRSCNELGAKGSDVQGIGLTGAAASGGQGAPGSSGFYFNDEQSYTASCPSGQVGSNQTATIPAGAVTSALSKADANAKALSQAQANATNALNCTSSIGTFLNTPQTYVAQCPAASGNVPAAVGTSVTKTIAAGTYRSTVSQELADAAALNAAQVAAIAELICTYYNAPQSITANCPSGTTGSPVTKTVAAATYSADSQTKADQLAIADAQSQANAALSCSQNTIIVGNTVQTARLSGTTPVAGCSSPFIYNITATVPANTYTQRATTDTATGAQLTLNQQALAAANAAAQAEYQLELNRFRLSCSRLFVGQG